MVTAMLMLILWDLWTELLACLRPVRTIWCLWALPYKHLCLQPVSGFEVYNSSGGKQGALPSLQCFFLSLKIGTLYIPLSLQPTPSPLLLLDFTFWAEVIMFMSAASSFFYSFPLCVWTVRRTNVLKQARTRKALTCHCLWLRQQNKSTPNSGRKAVYLINFHFSLQRMLGILFGWKFFQQGCCKKGRNLS